MRVIVVLVSAIFATYPALAQPYVFCATANRVANTATLASYTNTQIENGLCMTTRLTAQAVGTGDTVSERLCLSAAAHFMREFKARFPRRDAKSVAGRC